MKLTHPRMENVLEVARGSVCSLVIEHQGLFRELLTDIACGLVGDNVPLVLSKGNAPIEISKYLELIADFITFDINRKPILGKIITALEKNAADAEHYLNTQELLCMLENRIGDWAFQLIGDIIPTKISIPSILKAAGIELRDTYTGEYGAVEKLIDYMELVREYERDKLFVTVNMRSYFQDSAIEQFCKTVKAHEYRVLMIENKSYKLLENERRITIDEDLCEF